MVSAVQRKKRQRNRSRIHFSEAVKGIMFTGLLPNVLPAQCSSDSSVSHPPISAARLLPIPGNSLSPASPLA